MAVAAAGPERLGTFGWVRSRGRAARALTAWVLPLVLVLYLAFNSGGYAITTYGQVSIAVWWIITVCAAWGLLPFSRTRGSARASILFFAGFTAWTALGITWSISRGRSFDDLALVSCYLGILVLAVQIHREREEALRRTVTAVAAAIVIVAITAVASRLWPGLFPGSQSAAAMPGNSGAARLAWPIGYWNALAALMAIGLPLLLGLSTSARARWARSAAAAAIPLVALCGALTQSRGALVEGVAGVVVFIALAPRRATKLISAAIAACGSALLVADALRYRAITNDLGGSHSGQAWMVALTAVVICAGVGLAHAGADRGLSRTTLPRLLSPPPRQARIGLLAALVLLGAVGLVAHGPAHLSHAWSSFKTASGSSSSSNHFAASGGEGRYQFWTAGIDSASSHPFTGSGPGTFQLDWLPRATVPVYTTNAHSLYVETYAELGLVGFLLLAAFLLTVVVALVRQVIRSEAADRVRAAAATAALTAFLVGAAIDWLWQLPVVVAVVLLLAAAGVAPAREPSAPGPDGRTPGATPRAAWPVRGAAVLVGLACILAAAHPLAADRAIINSQNAVEAGHLTAAIIDARDAVAVESGSAAAQLQLAQSLGDAGRYREALAAARAATLAEPQGWSNWYVLGQLDVDLGRLGAAESAFVRARTLNPQLYP